MGVGNPARAKYHYENPDATRRFEEMAGVHTVEQVTRQHAIRFIEQLINTGQTPQNNNMHLGEPDKAPELRNAARSDRANEASGLTVKAPSEERARRSFDLTALKSIFIRVLTEGRRGRIILASALGTLYGCAVGGALPVASGRRVF